MNTQLHRVQPDEMPVQFVDSPSVEDEQEGPGLFIYVALALWSVIMFSAGWFIRSLLS